MGETGFIVQCGQGLNCLHINSKGSSWSRGGGGGGGAMVTLFVLYVWLAISDYLLSFNILTFKKIQVKHLKGQK